MNAEDISTPRSLVIELSVKQEALINEIISKLLGIDSNESRSFGTTSQALSFNSKANLLLDLKQLDKFQVEKYKIFMEIRNKFAHVNSVDTFEKCFKLLGNYTRLKKLLQIDIKEDSIEKEMETIFCMLSIDITSSLAIIRDNLYKDMAKKYTQRRWSEVFKERKQDYKKENPHHAAAVDDFIRYLKNILIQEVDENIKNQIPPQV
jgi:hypothetical protein